MSSFRAISNQLNYHKICREVVKEMKLSKFQDKEEKKIKPNSSSRIQFHHAQNIKIHDFNSNSKWTEKNYLNNKGSRRIFRVKRWEWLPVWDPVRWKNDEGVVRRYNRSSEEAKLLRSPVSKSSDGNWQPGGPGCFCPPQPLPIF